jgi:hypothetical protein
MSLTLELLKAMREVQERWDWLLIPYSRRTPTQHRQTALADKIVVEVNS